MRTVERTLLGLGLLVWLPAIPFALALLAASLTGCLLSKGAVHPCIVAGIDFGPPLTLMALMTWVVIALLPFMALTLVVGLGWGLVRLVLVWRLARQARHGRGPTAT